MCAFLCIVTCLSPAFGHYSQCEVLVVGAYKYAAKFPPGDILQGVVNPECAHLQCQPLSNRLKTSQVVKPEWNTTSFVWQLN